jgi:iron complex outermembrane receptor protein
MHGRIGPHNPSCKARPMAILRCMTALSFALLCGASLGTEIKGKDFIDLSLEELANFRVTSVSKKEERLADVAASIYIITGDAIRRAGAYSLPEALRLAPNLQVAQMTANQFAISARGFNSSTANKLLVMIDGRTVYTPLYSGVFWDQQNVMLQDVDRIEVISGPGGTIWGTNAVNGVINIISKSAAKTGGNLLHARAGTAGQGVAVRHAANVDGGAYRAYAKFDRWQHTVHANDLAERDGWKHAQAGFRTDLHVPRGDLSLLGDIYRADVDQAAPGRVGMSGANLLVRWSPAMDNGGHVVLQSYLDHTQRDVPGTFAETLNTVDLELQYTLPHKGSTSTMVGGGYRLSADNVTNSASLAFLPAKATLHWSNLFVQQQRDLLEGLRLTAGLRLESNDYTGIEWLPSLKLAYKLKGDHLLWLGLARSVRAPSRIDTSFFVPSKPPFLLAGGPDFRSEIANTLDLGMRGAMGNGISYSIDVFHSQYRRLRSIDRLPGGVFVFANHIEGNVNGAEAWLNFQASKDWSIEAGATLLHAHLRGPVAQAPPGNDPKTQLSLRAKWHGAANYEWDLALRHVSALPKPAVPAYTVLDLHGGWRVSRDLTLRLSAVNLFNRRHTEFLSNNAAGNPIRLGRHIGLDLTTSF